MSAPSNRIDPALGLSCPEIRLKYVVLPAPFGPTIAVSSPGRNAQLTPLTATWPPKRMVSARVSRERVMERLVSRTRSSVLDAAAQSRDRTIHRTVMAGLDPAIHLLRKTLA